FGEAGKVPVSHRPGPFFGLLSAYKALVLSHASTQRMTNASVMVAAGTAFNGVGARYSPPAQVRPDLHQRADGPPAASVIETQAHYGPGSGRVG
ncbi:MAG: hypothetical protein AAF583_17415, partial [Pseudomonadota bacterium]